jgi:hypothetical protein
MGAMAALVGLFSGEALEKLKEIAGSVFKRVGESSDPLKPAKTTPGTEPPNAASPSGTAESASPNQPAEDAIEKPENKG